MKRQEKAGADWGRARLEHEGPVTAGEYCTLRYVFRAGHPIDDSGFVKIVFRHVSDFGTPQFTSPGEDNFCAVGSNGDCRISPTWNARAHRRPWGKTILLQVTGGYLDRGEEISVVFGDRAGGSPGWRMQTFVERTFEFRTFSDPFATFNFKELPGSPRLAVVSGPAARAVCIAPSRVAVGKPFDYWLKLEDAWGNPTGRPSRIRHAGLAGEGYHYLEAADAGTGLKAVSNPVLATAAPGGANRYWADFHGQSEETIGSNSIDDYFRFARDYARLDIIGHQGNDFQVSDAFWNKIGKTAAKYNEDGRLVAFPGFEWSGNTPLGGDRNVYFVSGGEISRSSRDLLPGRRSKYEDSPTAEDLFRNLRRQAAARPFVFAHVGGRYANIDMHDPELEAAVEIHSAWGTFEWLLEDALKRGYRVGVCANSDGHKGRPGASYPGAGLFGSYGGLTCVLCPALTREDVYQSLRRRHFYATTGNRCLIDLCLVSGGRALGTIGDEVAVRPGAGVVLKAAIAGTAPIESVEVRNGLRVVREFRPGDQGKTGHRLKVAWSGAERRGRSRMTDWAGALEARGNEITGVTPVNFHHPGRQPERVGKNRLRWQSCTTGGVAGCIIELREAGKGELLIETLQGRAACDLARTCRAARVFRFGGLDKKITVAGLPDAPGERLVEIACPVEISGEGDNPLYLKVSQLDGHMAWTSPVYVRAGS